MNIHMLIIHRKLVYLKAREIVQQKMCLHGFSGFDPKYLILFPDPSWSDPRAQSQSKT